MTWIAPSRWLEQLLGDWTYAFRTADGSDHPGATATGHEVVRAIGESFVVIENTNRSDQDGSHSQSVTLVGYEPGGDRFTGAVAGTAVPALFVYSGQLSDNGDSLLLETEGPTMTDGNISDRYRDVICVIDADHRYTAAEVWQEGRWVEFMRSEFVRSR